jgi:hypothetical protein
MSLGSQDGTAVAEQVLLNGAAPDRSCGERSGWQAVRMNEVSVSEQDATFTWHCSR